MMDESRNEECKIKTRPRLWTIICWLIGLIVCIAMLVNIFGPLGNGSGIPLMDVQDTSHAPRYYGAANSINKGSGLEGSELMVSVTARFIEALPDTYTFYNDWYQNEYCLLRMEVIKVLSGKSMPDEFLFLMPVEYMTDYSIYDIFVLKMMQEGYEYSVMYNKTQDRPQQLDLALFGHAYDTMGMMMPFDADGHYDMRLWESTEAWKKHTDEAIELFGAEFYQRYQNLTLQDMETERYYPNSQVHVQRIEGVKGTAVDAMAYVQNLKNGTYVSYNGKDILSMSSQVQLYFERYIDGFRSNESGMIYADKVKWSKARFTEGDMQNLPDLPAALETVIAALEAGEIKLGHIQGLKEGVRSSNSVFGWYAKTNKGIIGIVRVNWCFGERYDDAYYVIEYGFDTCFPIDRDDLLDVIGDYETTYIYTGEYDEHGKVERYGTRP